MSARTRYMIEGICLAKIPAPLVSFATSPENAPSLLISTLLINALAFEIRLNLGYLILTYVLITIYFGLLLLYAIMAVNSCQADLTNFNRHVFYASIFGGIALVLLWSDFILGYFYNGDVLFSLLPNLRNQELGCIDRIHLTCLFNSHCSLAYWANNHGQSRTKSIGKIWVASIHSSHVHATLHNPIHLPSSRI